MSKDPYKYFRIEARELLDELSKGALALEKSSVDEAGTVVVRLLRLAHTLKGAARVVKQRTVADAAHAIEDVLAPVRDEGATIDRAKIDAILGQLDEITNALGALDSPPADLTSMGKLPLPGITELTIDRAPKIAETRTTSADVSHLLEGVTEVGVQLASLRTSVAELDHVSRLAEILASQLSSPRMRANADLFGARSTMEDLRRTLMATERGLTNALAQTGRELHDVREAAERLRLVPAGRMFAVLERTARDSAVSLGKRVDFDAEGGDVRLDADVLGVVQSALVQAVRNAVAHGIERDRANAGKNERGAIMVSIVRAGRWVRFSCTDDGRGVDLTAVRNVAARRGDSDVTAMTDDALLRHLLRGGISTSTSVNEIAGRGVGLDVVSDAARRLGGEVTLDTKTGRGTTVTITIPFSVAAVDALIVEANGRVVAIPIEGVERAVRFHTEDLLRDVERASLLLDGAAVPFAPLGRAFAAAAGTFERRAWSAVIVKSEGGTAAIGVDRLIRTETVVMHPLPSVAVADPSVAGASFDAEGNPQVILDVAELVRRARAMVVVSAPTKRLPILVIDDSLTTRMLEQSILESAGYEVDTATSGEEGMVKARLRHYGLFLVDVEMPKMDGFTFVEETRKDPDLKLVPAILVTSRNAPEDLARGKRAGAVAYVVKSEFDQKSLLDRIGRLVG